MKPVLSSSSYASIVDQWQNSMNPGVFLQFQFDVVQSEELNVQKKLGMGTKLSLTSVFNSFSGWLIMLSMR